jgi:hypothetical protein
MHFDERALTEKYWINIQFVALLAANWTPLRPLFCIWGQADGPFLVLDRSNTLRVSVYEVSP